MDPTASIQRLGFRKWYERELIKCHAALVTCFLCGITVAALLEQVEIVEFGWRPLSMLAIVFFASLLGWASWRSYITVLQRAERYGERSSCPNCRAYARFRVIDTGIDTYPSQAAEAVAPLQSAWLKVVCRKCGTGWRMPE
ncbi:MAG TPA: hypothetical protein VEC19_05455 [Usitatibacter sp.]|nr:hypothetical protein [Usitatibacter sp.]